MISIIFSLEISHTWFEKKIVWVAASVANTTDANPNGIKTLWLMV